MTVVIQRDASPGATSPHGENELKIVRSKAKMPNGMSMRQWRKGPGSRFMSKRSIWSYTAPVGANVGGTQSGNTATHFNNPPSGPPNIAFT